MPNLGSVIGNAPKISTGWTRVRQKICNLPMSLQDYWTIHEKMLIAPYVAGSADTSKPLLGFKQPVLPMKLRPTLLHFQASCLPYGYMYHNQTKITTGKVSMLAAPISSAHQCMHLRLTCLSFPVRIPLPFILPHGYTTSAAFSPFASSHVHKALSHQYCTDATAISPCLQQIDV